MVSGQSFGSSAVSLACITSLCSVQCFRGGHSLSLAFGSFFYPHPSPPLNFPLLNQCDGGLVPLAWGLKAGGRGFASHGGITFSFFYPHPSPPLNFPLLNQCDGGLVPLAWGLKAGGRGFASHGGITFSTGWPCQRWKPLDILGTHLHSATQLLIIYETI